MLTVWNQVTTEFYGRRICAAYMIENQMLKVKTPRGDRRRNWKAQTRTS